MQNQILENKQSSKSIEKEQEKQTNNDQNHREYYSKAQFWDERYEQHGGFFDWYAQFPELKYAFQTQYNMQKKDSILMIGCGNSKLSQQMYDAGYTNIINIDISPSVIQQMKKVSPSMEWLVMDATNMTFEDNHFDYVIDKGTMDALIAGRDLSPAVKLLKQCIRVTKQQGQLILITYGSPQGRKKVFQNALPFNVFDYYFAYVNLNDMSTMINLMRNNLVGPNGEKVQHQQALQRSMKQFMMIKILRQKRSKDKQFVVWENVNNKINTEILNLANKQQLKQKNKGQPKKQSETKFQGNKEQTTRQTQVQKKTQIQFSSQNQKQSYVYAYSIKRKLGYNFDLSSYQNLTIFNQYQGHQKMKNLEIRGNKYFIQQNLSKCIAFCKQKNIAFSRVTLKDQNSSFFSNDKITKLNILKGKQLNFNILKKTNLDFSLKFDGLDKVDDFLLKISAHILENMQLKLMASPKSYSLFSMIKSRMKFKTTNELIARYWTPTYKIKSIDLQSKIASVTLSIPPVLSSTTQEVKSQMLDFTIKYSSSLKKHRSQPEKYSIQFLDVRHGFISFPQLQIFGVLNMASLSYNKGQSLKVSMQDFWSQGEGQNSAQEENLQQCKYFRVQQGRVEVPESLIHQVLLHLLVLY